MSSISFATLRQTLATRWLWLPCLIVALGVSFTAKADPAGRVGRLSVIEGQIHLDNPSRNESFDPSVNQPLTSGDVLITEPRTRAEIQIGSASIRLDGDTRLSLSRIDDEAIALSLDYGRVITRFASRDTLNDFSMLTPSGRFSGRDSGAYPAVFRFDVDGNETRATSYYGNLRAVTDARTTVLGGGDSVAFWPEDSRAVRPQSDDFTHWSAVRDREIQARSANYSRYVSPEMTGAEDLDAYGSWGMSAEYGTVWYPRGVGRDWAPYRNGRWAWVDPWGWTWVADEPWGFAPFHYGRWVLIGGVWAWVPGERVARPIYAPALVAWVGNSGASFSMSVGGGSVGWFPLGPREAYVPSYRVSAPYLRNVNRGHVDRFEDVDRYVRSPDDALRQMHYMNRDQARAVTMVPADVVTRRRSVAGAVLPLRENPQWQNQSIRVAPEVNAQPLRPQFHGNDGREASRVIMPERQNVVPNPARPSASAPRDVVAPIDRGQQAPPSVRPSESRPAVQELRGRQLNANDAMRPDVNVPPTGANAVMRREVVRPVEENRGSQSRDGGDRASRREVQVGTPAVQQNQGAAIRPDNNQRERTVIQTERRVERRESPNDNNRDRPQEQKDRRKNAEDSDRR